MSRAALGLALLLAGCATPDGTADRLAEGLAAVEVAARRDRPDADPATVDVQLAPDADFLRRHGAEAVPLLRAAVAAADRELGPPSGLRFRVGGWTVFRSTPGVHDDFRLLWEARLRVPAAGCDVVAAFSGQRGGAHAGACLPGLRVILGLQPEDPVHNFVHEAAHLLGARDWPRGTPGYGTPSVMTYDSDQPRTLVLDPVNRARIAARAGALAPRQADAVAAALLARAGALPAGTRAALIGSFLAAESRRSQRDGLDASIRLLEEQPHGPVAPWINGECRRLTGDPDDAAVLFLLALRDLRDDPAPDALARHAALEIAALAIDDVQRLGALREEAAATLTRLAELHPDDAALLDRLGSLRARVGAKTAAADLYRRAAAAAPAATWPWRHLAALGRATRDAALWHEGWNGWLEREPGDPEWPVRRVAEAVRDFPAVLDDPVEAARARAALDAAEAAWPGWDLPRALRRVLP